MESDPTSAAEGPPTVAAANPCLTLDVLRASGHHRVNPVRFRQIEAMATRAENHGGELRRVLDCRLSEMLAEYSEAAKRGAADPDAVLAPANHGPLTELVAELKSQRSSDKRALESSGNHLGQPSVPMTETLGYIRSTWSRLSAKQRLTQSLRDVPDKAGPLNSSHLVHQSLKLMHDVSPQYLHRFISYVDALLWLDQASEGAAGVGAEPPRANRPGKTKRTT